MRTAPEHFFDQNGVFRFNHAPELRDCTGLDPKRGWPGCASCNNRESSWQTIECFEFREGTYQVNGRSYFGGFLVQQPKENIDETSCLAAQAGEEKLTKPRVIHGVTYAVFHATHSPGGGDRHEEWETYRTYHRGRCYALVIRKGWTSRSRVTYVTEESRAAAIRSIDKRFAEPVNTFEFLK